MLKLYLLTYSCNAVTVKLYRIIALPFPEIDLVQLRAVHLHLLILLCRLKSFEHADNVMLLVACACGGGADILTDASTYNATSMPVP